MKQWVWLAVRDDGEVRVIGIFAKDDDARRACDNDSESLLRWDHHEARGSAPEVWMSQGHITYEVTREEVQR